MVSLPYHHPFNVAQRMEQVDYMTGGRVIFGSGPGARASDGLRIGAAVSAIEVPRSTHSCGTRDRRGLPPLPRGAPDTRVVEDRLAQALDGGDPGDEGCYLLGSPVNA